MTDKKISELPAATTVAPSDLVAVVQGGATKKATASLLGSPSATAVLAEAAGYWIADHCPAEGVVGVWANEGTAGSDYDIPVDGNQTPLERSHSYFYGHQQLRVDRENILQSMGFQGKTHGVRPADADLPGTLVTCNLYRVETDGSAVLMVQNAIYIDADYTVHWTGTAWEADRLTFETFDITLGTPLPASIPATAPVNLVFGAGGSSLSVSFGADNASWSPSTIWLSGPPFNNAYEYTVDRPAHLEIRSDNYDGWFFNGFFPSVAYPGSYNPTDTVPWVDNLSINLDVLPLLTGSDFTLLVWGNDVHLQWDTGYMGCNAEPFGPLLVTFGSGLQLVALDEFKPGRNPADVYRFEACGMRWDHVAGQWSVKAANAPWTSFGPTAGADPDVDPLAATLLLREHIAARLAIWTRLLTADEAEAVFKEWFAAYPALLG